MLREFQRGDFASEVPLHIFIRQYGRAFWDENGKPQGPEATKTGRDAFMDIMHWSGRADEDTSWEDFRDEYPED